MDIQVGIPIIAEDGDAGRVSGIILHPRTNELTAIVATQQINMLPHDVVVPVDRIIGADKEAVHVRGTVEEIGDLDAFAQSQYVSPPEDWIPPLGGPPTHYLFPATPYSVGAFTFPSVQSPPAPREVENLDPGEIEVSGTTEVFLPDGDRVGHIDRVITEPDTDQVTHLVVRRGLGRDVVVPADRISRMDDEGVHLALTDDELEEMPAAP